MTNIINLIINRFKRKLYLLFNFWFGFKLNIKNFFFKQKQKKNKIYIY